MTNQTVVALSEVTNDKICVDCFLGSVTISGASGQEDIGATNIEEQESSEMNEPVTKTTKLAADNSCDDRDTSASSWWRNGDVQTHQ